MQFANRAEKQIMQYRNRMHFTQRFALSWQVLRVYILVFQLRYTRNLSLGVSSWTSIATRTLYRPVETVTEDTTTLKVLPATRHSPHVHCVLGNLSRLVAVAACKPARGCMRARVTCIRTNIESISSPALGQSFSISCVFFLISATVARTRLAIESRRKTVFTREKALREIKLLQLRIVRLFFVSRNALRRMYNPSL